MKPKYAIFVMFVVMLFALGMVAQTATAPAAPSEGKTCAACCNHAQSCCKDGKCCDMKDGKMACKTDCCKDGKCEMAKSGKSCCGKSCKMSKTS